MNKLSPIILTILSITSLCSTAHATELDCLTRIIHAESRGEPVEAVAITAQAAINRADDGKFCALIKSGIVNASKLVPTEVKPYFTAIAKAAISAKTDISKGANAWNTGTRPRQPGEITRISGKQVFYVLAANPESKP